MNEATTAQEENMNAISSRSINGQPQYHTTPQSRVAWREEMLDDLLNQMRDRQLPADAPVALLKEAAIPGKGTYVDLYV